VISRKENLSLAVIYFAIIASKFSTRVKISLIVICESLIRGSQLGELRAKIIARRLLTQFR